MNTLSLSCSECMPLWPVSFLELIYEALVHALVLRPVLAFMGLLLLGVDLPQLELGRLEECRDH
jgi:hypothetical protein